MIRERLSELRSRIEQACRRTNRDAKDVEWVLVTKQVAPDLIREAYEAGCRDFGENRVQEWLDKKDELPADIRWHLIGHLQTNKVRFCVGRTVLIHSLESVKLAHAIDARAGEEGARVDCLLQVNTSGEATKFGFLGEEVRKELPMILACPNLCIKGLMTIAPLTEDESLVRAAFRNLKELFEEFRNKYTWVDWKYLSMGMSSDFELAVEEGANLLRIGTAVFGKRSG